MFYLNITISSEINKLSTKQCLLFCVLNIPKDYRGKKERNKINHIYYVLLLNGSKKVFRMIISPRFYKKTLKKPCFTSFFEGCN